MNCIEKSLYDDEAMKESREKLGRKLHRILIRQYMSGNRDIIEEEEVGTCHEGGRMITPEL